MELLCHLPLPTHFILDFYLLHRRPFSSPTHLNLKARFKIKFFTGIGSYPNYALLLASLLGRPGVRPVDLPLPGEGELAELVADLVLGDLGADEVLPVVNPHGGVDELRQDGGPARPDLLVREEVPPVLDLRQERVDEDALPQGSRHSFAFGSGPCFPELKEEEKEGQQSHCSAAERREEG